MTLEPLFLSRLILTSAALLTSACAAWDARAFRIPNAYCLGIVLLFPLYGLVVPGGVPWGAHLLCAALVFGAGLFLYRRRWMGAGDVKLLSALALWAGMNQIGPLMIVTALSGGVMSLALAVTALCHRGTLAEDRKTTALHRALRTRVPYGIAIALGGLCVFYVRLLAG